RCAAILAAIDAGAGRCEILRARLRLDDRHENLRIPVIHVEPDASGFSRRQPGCQLRPRSTTIGRLEDSAVSATSVVAPRKTLALIERCVENVRIAGIHDDIGGADPGIVRQSAAQPLPVLSAVGGLEYATIAG